MKVIDNSPKDDGLGIGLSETISLIIVVVTPQSLIDCFMFQQVMPLPKERNGKKN